MQVTDKDREYTIDCVEDKPTRGMWNCGSNPVWVTVTHVPTMMSVRVYSHQQHKALSKAKEHLSQMVNDAGDKKCSYPAALAGQWQDISTAPMDGSPFLVFCDNGTYSCAFIKNHHQIFSTSGEFLDAIPTQWHPLPTPIKVKDK